MTMITNLVNDASHFNSVQSVIFQFFSGNFIFIWNPETQKKTENISKYRHEWGARFVSFRIENGMEVKILAQ